MAVDAVSLSGRVAQAIEQVIRQCGISPPPTAILRRKFLRVLDGDGARLVIIDVADDEQYEAISNGTPGKLLWGCKRPCGVALGYANDGRTGNNEDLRTARMKIEDAMNALNLQRAGLVGEECSANDVMPYGRPIFGASDSSGRDWSVMTFTVETLENKAYGG